ncbi:hypothetical protein R3P38DRAFT_2777880, partial [Favolaschia claudopus]
PYQQPSWPNPTDVTRLDWHWANLKMKRDFVRLGPIVKATLQNRQLQKRKKSVEGNITLGSAQFVAYLLLAYGPLPSAEKIRAKNRIHIAQKRSKPSRAETPQDPELTAAELAATETLAQMQADRAAQELGFHDPRGNSPTSRSREEIAIDEEISALWEEGHGSVADCCSFKHWAPDLHLATLHLLTLRVQFPSNVYRASTTNCSESIRRKIEGRSGRTDERAGSCNGHVQCVMWTTWYLPAGSVNPQRLDSVII